MASETSGDKVAHMCRLSAYAYNSQKIRSLFCKPFVKQKLKVHLFVNVNNFASAIN